MRRSEFIAEPPASIADLVEFCEENSLSAADDLVSASDLDNCVCRDIRDMTNDEYWYNIRDCLNDIEEGCEWYVRDGSLDYSGFDNGWESLYDRIIDEMDSNDLWDDEDDEEDDEDDDEEYEDDEDDAYGCSGKERDDSEAYGVFTIDSLFESDSISVLRAEAEEGDRVRRELKQAKERRFSEFVRETVSRAEINAAAEEKERIESFRTIFG